MKMQRIPLEKRLAAAGEGDGTGVCPPAAWVFLEDYFLCLSRESGDPSHKAYYKKLLWDGSRAYGDVKNMFVAEAAAKALAGACPEEGRTELLLRLLVAPFCGREEEDEGGSR